MHKNTVSENLNKISIVVPVYNAEKTLRRCVNSLINQTHKNIEIILVDDGSRDSSLEICKLYEAADHRIKVISKENGGVSSARNIGIMAAVGKYIMFCDSDDWVEADWCEILFEQYAPNHLVMCAYYCHYSDGKVDLISCKDEITLIDNTDFFLAKKLGIYNPWNKIFDLSIIHHNHLFFSEKLTVGEDELFVWEYLKFVSGGIIVCNKALNHYTWPRNNSLTLNLPDNYYQQCQFLFRQIYKDLIKGDICSNNAQKVFFNDCYWQYKRGIRQIFQDKSISISKRIDKANIVIKSAEYQLILHNTNTEKNKIMKKALNCKSCIVLYMLFLIGKY